MFDISIHISVASSIHWLSQRSALFIASPAPLAALSAAKAVSDLELRVPRELRAFSIAPAVAPGDPVIETGVFPTKNGVKV